MPHDQQAIQQTKRNRWEDEQIHRRDAVGMIVEKCFPTLGRRPSTRGHILGYAGLPNFDTELEQLSMNPWSSPERIGDAHLADQLSYPVRTVLVPIFPSQKADQGNTGPFLLRVRHRRVHISASALLHSNKRTSNQP